MDLNRPIPMPPPVENTLLSLQTRNVHNTNSATLPNGNNINGLPAIPSIQPASVINLSNSSDVVIGPMTQYQGAVTIYQYMDATVESRTAGSSNLAIGRNSRSNNNNRNVPFSLSNLPPWIIILLTLIVAALIGIVLYFLFLNDAKGAKEEKKEILFSDNYDGRLMPNLGNNHLIIERLQWGASESANATIPLKHPIPYVMLTHIGVQSIPCFNVYKCSIKMRTIQDSAIAEKNLPDLPANFYVSSDGNIYVGRGWELANAYSNVSLAICFMGDYIRYQAEPTQFDAVQHLIAFGVTQKYISHDYKLVAHNQTTKTMGPGSGIYREIQKWRHWYRCGTPGEPYCGMEYDTPQFWKATQ